MKLTYFQLEAQLAKQIAPIYIISSDELLLKQDAIRLIQKSAKTAGFTEIVRIAKEAGTALEEQLQNELYAISMLAEKRLFLLDFRDSLPTKAASEVLEAYAKKPSPDNVIIIDVSKLDDKISRSSWFKACEKTGMLVTLWPLSREQLPAWIMTRAKKYKLALQPDAISLLADYVEGNLVAAAQTIEKIYLLQPTEPINASVIEKILTDESRFSIFDFIENVIAGNKARSLHILKTLQEDGSEPAIILWGIARELRMLADLAEQVKQGASLETLFTKYRIFAKRQQAVRQYLQKHTAPHCWGYLHHAAHIDTLIKGANAGDAWQALELFCLR